MAAQPPPPPTSEVPSIPSELNVGVLAIQGSFAEHVQVMQGLGVTCREVRLPEELDGLDGIILPGGESTAMAIVGEPTGVFPALREYVKSGRPVWGTCAGMILLSNTAVFTKAGGQALVGGLDVEVCRNYFGSQVQSCEMDLKVSALAEAEGADGHRAVFIRAPAILNAGPGVEVLASVRARPCMQAREVVSRTWADAGKTLDEVPEVVVAVRQGPIMATAFHPEFTADTRWHELFLASVREAAAARAP